MCFSQYFYSVLVIACDFLLAIVVLGSFFVLLTPCVFPAVSIPYAQEVTVW